MWKKTTTKSKSKTIASQKNKEKQKRFRNWSFLLRDYKIQSYLFTLYDPIYFSFSTPSLTPHSTRFTQLHPDRLLSRAGDGFQLRLPWRYQNHKGIANNLRPPPWHCIDQRRHFRLTLEPGSGMKTPSKIGGFWLTISPRIEPKGVVGSPGVPALRCWVFGFHGSSELGAT